MLEAFSIEPEHPEQTCIRHLDGNALNNTLENLKWGTAKENSNDMVKHGMSTVLSYVQHSIVSIEADGEEMTYDLEVCGPYHNFVVGNAVVHNSVNEHSTRYSEVPEEFYTTEPNAWRSQSKTARQGSGDNLPEEVGGSLSANEVTIQDIAYLTYKGRLEAGVAREQARKDLPLSTYTTAYWKIDLHNLFNFLERRLAPDAQYEIRQYAQAIADIVKVWVPHAWEAFEDYRLNAMKLSAQELAAIRSFITNGDRYIVAEGLSKGETEEFHEKLSRFGYNKHRYQQS
jgi:hypothetical protein